ncbi:MAG: hypothetical protein M3280_10125 [Actinomycetota bacterium]|nr:hypothetical protein [Actinomycetota bacterium]
MTLNPRTRPSPALVISLLALFVALTGTATALRGKNTVFSDDIVNGQVKSSDALDNGLTGRDIREGSLVGVRPYGKTIPSGTTVKGAWGGGANTVGPIEKTDFLVSLPAPAPVALTSETVNFEAGEGAASDADSDCDGTDDAPTAPPGEVCIYTGTNIGGSPAFSGNAIDDDHSASDRLGFVITIHKPGSPSDTTVNTMQAHGTWAYTAP